MAQGTFHAHGKYFPLNNVQLLLNLWICLGIVHNLANYFDSSLECFCLIDDEVQGFKNPQGMLYYGL